MIRASPAVRPRAAEWHARGSTGGRAHPPIAGRRHPHRAARRRRDADAIAKAMTRARFLHLATHGSPDGLYLADDTAASPSLSSAHVYGLRLQADLAVLSACGTFKGELRTDGDVGIVRVARSSRPAWLARRLAVESGRRGDQGAYGAILRAVHMREGRRGERGRDDGRRGAVTAHGDVRDDRGARAVAIKAVGGIRHVCGLCKSCGSCGTGLLVVGRAASTRDN